MTDERVEPTKEWLDALIDDIMNGHAHFALMPDEERKEPAEALRRLRDAILASQPERVRCPKPKFHEFVARHEGKLGPIAECPYCGQSLKGAGEK